MFLAGASSLFHGKKAKLLPPLYLSWGKCWVVPSLPRGPLAQVALPPQMAANPIHLHQSEP